MSSTNNNQNKPLLSNLSISNANKNKNKNNDKKLTFSPNDDSNEDFIMQKNKRHLSSSSSTSTHGPLTPSTLNNNKNKKLFKTTNRYELLSPDEPPEEKLLNDVFVHNSSHNDTPKPPPPIFVRGVIDYTELCKKLIDLIGVDNFFCKSSSDRLKIQTANPESYRTLVRYLKEENAEFHTYQLKEDKPIRVVIRNLHPSTQTELIKEELEVRLFEVRRVTNVLHRITKLQLPLFFVDLEPTPKSSEIFQLSSLLHTKIKIEEPYKPKSISQCNNCQEYGHTKTYCGYPARCVRCGDFYQSAHSVPEIIQPLIRVVQYIGSYNATGNLPPAVIFYLIILEIRIQLLKIATHQLKLL